ncbi:MAG: glycosyltransferase family 61 protein [Rickettsiales bacterium]
MIDPPSGQRYKKSGFSGFVNLRAVRARLRRHALAFFPFAAKRLNYYPELQNARITSTEILYREFRSAPPEAFGIDFDRDARRYMEFRREPVPKELGVEFTVTLHRNATLLGHTGTAIDGGAVVAPTAWGAAERNYSKIATLKSVKGDPETLYLPMLGVRRGHRQYFHFLAEYMTTLHLFLTRTHRPKRPVVIVTRTDLSAVQEEIYDEIIKAFPETSLLRLSPREKLLCPSMAVPDYSTTGKTGAFFSPEYVAFIDGLLARRYGAIDAAPDKDFYVSRRDAKLRHLENEGEIESVLRERGFETIVPGEMSLREQFFAFRRARTLVATHGAGLTNLLFVPRGGKIVECASQDFGGCAFMWISAAKGLRHRLAVGGKEGKRQRYSIAVETLLDALDAP